METMLSGTKQFTVSEMQLIALIYSCPLGELSSKCALFQTRKIVKSDYQKAINSFEPEEINSLISEHKKCLFERVKSSDIESIKNGNHEINKKIAYLIWTGKGNLDFLISELIKRNWIKTKSNFAELFGNSDINLRILWKAQYKYELAYLLHKFKEEGYFRTVNSKGYFRIAEQYIIDYSKNILKNNSLKQISSKISLNPEKYTDIIESVENVIRAICLNANRL